MNLKLVVNILIIAIMAWSGLSLLAVGVFWAAEKIEAWYLRRRH